MRTKEIGNATYEQGRPTGGPIQSWDHTRKLSVNILPRSGQRFPVKGLLARPLHQDPSTGAA